MCHYRVSEPSYTYKCTGRCIEAFLCYFYNREAEKLEKIYKNQENHVYFISKSQNESSKIQKKKIITFQL